MKSKSEPKLHSYNKRNPAPPPGEGNHQWMYGAIGHLIDDHDGITDEEITREITGAVNRSPRPGEIEETIANYRDRKAKGLTGKGSAGKKRSPTFDRRIFDALANKGAGLSIPPDEIPKIKPLLAKMVFDYDIPAVGGEYEPDDVERLMFFCTDPKTAESGVHNFDEVTEEQLRNSQYFTPAPLRYQRVIDQADGKLKYRCKQNIAERRYFVFDFDHKSVADAHPSGSRESKKTLQRQVNAVLGAFGDRVELVVQTAGKGVHGFVRACGEEAADMARIAVAIGCDTSVINDPSKLVRMPTGMRYEGSKFVGTQSILHLNLPVDAPVESIAVDAIIDRARPHPTESDYFYTKGQWLSENAAGRWIANTDTSYKRNLRIRGHSDQRSDGVSELDIIMDQLQQERDINYAGPLAGHPAGYHEFGGVRAVVTEGLQLPVPLEGDYSTLDGFIHGLLGEEQSIVYKAWLARRFRCYSTNTYLQSQAVAFVGKPGCGKSLKQKIITASLGGRSVDGFAFIDGATNFNKDVAGAEHIFIEDKAREKNARARANFGSMVKNVTVNASQRIEGKNIDAVTLDPVWTTTISLNDDDDGLCVLPEMDDGETSGKLIIFHAKTFTFPVDMDSPDGEAYVSELMSQVPALLYALESFEIPEEFRDSRFGVISYHSPEIVNRLHGVGRHSELMELIDIAELWKEFSAAALDGVWTGTCEHLKATLLGNPATRQQASVLLRNPKTTGRLLTKAQAAFPSRISKRRLGVGVEWTIQEPKSCS